MKSIHILTVNVQETRAILYALQLPSYSVSCREWLLTGSNTSQGFP